MLDCLMNWSQQAHCDFVCELKSVELKILPEDEFYETAKYLCPNPSCIAECKMLLGVIRLSFIGPLTNSK